MSKSAERSRMALSVGLAVTACAAVLKIVLPSLDTLSGDQLVADQFILAGFAFFLGGLLLSGEEIRIPLSGALFLFFTLFAAGRGLAALPAEAVRQGAEWGAGAAVLIVTAWAFRNGRGAAAAGVFAGAVAAVAVTAFGQELLSLPELRARGAEIAASLPAAERVEFLERLNAHEVFGPFTISNALAAFCLLALGSFGGAFLHARGRRRAAVLPPLLLGAAVLFLTRSKGGFLAAGAGAAVAVGLALKARGAETRKAVLVTAGLLAVGVALTAGLVLFGPPGAGAESARVRLGYWTGGLRAACESPVVGGGAGTFADRYIALKDPAAGETKHAHCDYLEIFVEEGGLGLLLFAAALAALFAGRREISPAGAEGTRRRTAAAAGAVWVGCAAAYVFFGAGGFNDALAHVREGDAAWTVLAFAMLLVPPLTAGIAAGGSDGRTLAGLRTGVLAGLAAFLAHSAIDFDFFNEGAAFAFFAAAGVAGAGGRQVNIGKAGALAALVFALALSFLLPGQSRARDLTGLLVARADEPERRAARAAGGETASLARLLSADKPSFFAPSELCRAKGELCELLAPQGRGFLELAALHYRNAAGLNPLRYSHWEALGRVLLELAGNEEEKREEALRCYERAVERYPTNAALLLRAAAAFRKAGHAKRAEILERRASELLRLDLPPGARPPKGND